MSSIAPWLPVNLDLACSADCRSPECLRRVLNQFDLVNGERYKPGTFKCSGTRCNIFVWDATRALECEIPHWVDNNGCTVRPAAPGSHELSALGQIGWLRVFGDEYGWHKITLPEGRLLANKGCPVVVTWTNPNENQSSHVAMLLPTPNNEPIPHIAQAGRDNFFDGPITRGFGRLKVEVWTHD
jgi:hypothetical protein